MSHTDPVYIYSVCEEAVFFILELQKILNKNGLGSQVILSQECFNLAAGIYNCYPTKEINRNWTDFCLNRDIVLAIKFIKVPSFTPKEFFELLKTKTEYKDESVEFFEY